MTGASHWLAVLRVWGMRRALAFALVLGIGAGVYSSNVLLLPTLEQAIAVVNLVPPLAGTLLGHSLVEPLPDGARTAQRRLVPMFAARYAVLQLVGVIIVVVLAGTAGYAAWPAVPAFVALSAICVTALREWYWVPMLAVTYGWLQLGQGTVPDRLADLGLGGAAVAAVAGGAVYAILAPRWYRA